MFDDEWSTGASNICLSSNLVYFSGCGGSANDGAGLIGKLSLDGDSLWLNRYGGRRANVTGIVADHEGGLYATGYTYEYAEHGNADGFLMRVDSDGQELWRRQYGGNSTNMLAALISTQDAGLLMVGQTTSYGGGAQAYLVKADTTGEVIWFGAYGDSSGADLALEVAQAPNGDYLLAGYTNWSMGGSADMLVIRVSSDGEEIWRRNYGTARWGEELCDLVVLPGGDIVVVGEGGCPPNDTIMMRLNPDGEVVWETNYNVGAISFCNAMILSEDGGYYFVGSRILNGIQSAYLACTEPDPANNAVTLLDPAFPSGFEMVSPYPNPFNATTRLGFAVPRESRVQLRVYDLNGREVATLLDGVRPVGEYRIFWNAENLAAGSYFVRMEAGTFSATRKVLLVK